MLKIKRIFISDVKDTALCCNLQNLSGYVKDNDCCKLCFTTLESDNVSPWEIFTQDCFAGCMLKDECDQSL